MSGSATGFEEMLRGALEKARERAPEANNDLIKLTSEASNAVSRVSGGVARLELSPINVAGDDRPTYQLQLRRNDDSEAPWSDLGVFRLSETGYPIDRWPSRGNWDSNPDRPDRQHTNVADLKGNFEYMLSVPDSRLVVLLNYLVKLKSAK
jgi:hypothetical protein